MFQKPKKINKFLYIDQEFFNFLSYVLLVFWLRITLVEKIVKASPNLTN